MEQLDFPSIISHLDWFKWCPSCVVNVVEKLFCFYFCRCPMSRGAGVRASTLIYCNSLFFLDWTFPSLLCCTGTFSSRLHCVEGNLRHDTLSLLKQYLHNIRQITTGCQHVPASEYTSQRGRWPRIHQRRHGQDQWAGWGKRLLVVIEFPLKNFCNRNSAFPQEWCDTVQISTGCRTL